jgi:methyl-accepting chemotaxis protein
LHARGVDIFDLQYQDVPRTNPPKYKTRYDTEFARVMTPFYDQIVADIGILFYCNALDVNGYVPAHNAIYSQPVTGDYEHDLKYSRDKRKMLDAASQKAVNNRTDDYLLVTYLRDNGDVVSDLSFPIKVGGRHWGAMRFGIDANRL